MKNIINYLSGVICAVATLIVVVKHAIEIGAPCIGIDEVLMLVMMSAAVWMIIPPLYRSKIIKFFKKEIEEE